MNRSLGLSKAACIALLSLSVGGICTRAAEGDNPYHRVLEEYSNLMQAGDPEKQMEDPVARLKWIEGFEAELAGDSGPPDEYHYLMMKILADLYLKSGEYQASKDLYLALVNDQDVKPDLRLAAAGNNYHLSMQSMAPPEEAVQMHALYRGLNEEFKAQYPAFNNRAAEFDLFISEMTVGRYITDYGRNRSQELGPGTREAVEVETRFQLDGLTWMERFLARIEANPDRYASDLKDGYWDRPGILYNLADLANKISHGFQYLGQPEESLRQKEYAVGRLETLIKDHPRTLFTRNGGALLVDLKRHFLHGDPYIEYVRALTKEIIPGHEFLSALVEVGVDFSSNPGLLVTANKVFDLVLEYEKQWFPEEFPDHVNYQWALLEKAGNLLQLNDLREAGKILNELGSLQLKGDFLNSMLRKYQDRFLEEFGVDPSVVGRVGNAKRPGPRTSVSEGTEDSAASALNHVEIDTHRTGGPAQVPSVTGTIPANGAHLKKIGLGTTAALLTALLAVCLIVRRVRQEGHGDHE
jgi:hypothetical protein